VNRLYLWSTIILWITATVPRIYQFAEDATHSSLQRRARPPSFFAFCSLLLLLLCVWGIDSILSGILGIYLLIFGSYGVRGWKEGEAHDTNRCFLPAVTKVAVKISCKLLIPEYSYQVRRIHTIVKRSISDVLPGYCFRLLTQPVREFQIKFVWR